MSLSMRTSLVPLVSKPSLLSLLSSFACDTWTLTLHPQMPEQASLCSVL